MAASALLLGACVIVRATPGGPVTAVALGGAKVETCAIPAESDRAARPGAGALCVKAEGATLSSAARALVGVLLGGVPAQ